MNCKTMIVAVALSLVAAAPALAQESEPAAKFTGKAPVNLTLRLKPVREGDPNVKAIAVNAELRGVSGPVSLRMAIENVGRRGLADRIDGLEMRDAAGAVPLKIENDPTNKSGYAYYRHWRAERPVSGKVSYSYRVRPQPKPSGGPQYEFYSHNGGFNASGEPLLVLPEALPDVAMKVKWDLSDLARGSIAVSTFARGDFARRGPASGMTHGYYLVGPVGQYKPKKKGFEAYWLGRPAADPHKEMAWLEQGYDAMRDFWRDKDTKVYRVFIQTTGNGGGSAASNSFMGAWAAGNEDPAKQGPRMNVFHEINHYFVGSMRGDAKGARWFGEGANTHYTRMLAFRAGLIPLETYLDDINSNARRYYISAYRNKTAEEIDDLGYSTGFGGDGAQNLAYTRGSLFWGEIDYRLRQASGGKRTLDDVLVPMIVARRKGEPFTREKLFAELGPDAQALLDRTITRGETLEPSSGAFGPCLERKAETFTARGETFKGYQWVRVAGVPEEECRKW